MTRFLLLLLIPISSFTQSTSMVLDSVTRKPLSFATVRFFDKEQKLQRSVITDTGGRFQTAVFTGFIEISAVGYQKARFTGQQPEYFLSPLSKTLTAITVTSQRPIISTRPDGFVYDASQDVPIAGENTTDLLRKLPGLQVDPDGVPSMRGSTRIKVFIDGKPSDAYAPSIVDALRMIPSENIARIEIITQPSARYEGEGVDGVLQIYTKRPLQDGASGTISGYYQNRQRQLTGNIAIRRGQWIFTANPGYYYQNNINWTTQTRIENTGNRVDQYQVLTSDAKNLNAGIGLSYLADSLTILSAGYRPGIGWNDVRTQIDYHTATASFTRLIENPIDRHIHPLYWSYNRKTRDKKGESNFVGNYFNQQAETGYDLAQGGYKEKNINQGSNKELALEFNYTYGGFEAGAKSSYRRYRNNSLFIPDANRSQFFYFPRDIYGLYISQTINWKGFRIRAGGRYEQTIMTLDVGDTSIKIPDYKNFLPNLLINRRFGVHNLTAAYARRLQRPYINSLNPVINYIDSFNVSYGNPYLDPAISNNYDLTYSYVKSKWMITANFYWYQTIRSIEEVALLKPNDRIERTYLNISQNSTSGLSLQMNYRLPALTVNINNDLRYIDFGRRNGWVNNLTAYAIIRFTEEWSASAYILLNSKRIDLQGTTGGTRYYNFAANKTFKQGKYGLSIRLDNLFMPYQTITTINRTDSFISTSDSKQIRRFFRLGFNYKFGKKDIKVPNVRSTGGDN